MSAPECTPAPNCIFCTIVKENDQSKIVYQDDDVVAFPDIKPAAENHYLIIPRAHLPNAKDLDSSHRSLVEHMIKVGNDILTEKNADLSNSRLGFHWPPFNTITHLHLHAIAPVDKMSFVSKLIFRPDSYWFVSRYFHCKTGNCSYNLFSRRIWRKIDLSDGALLLTSDYVLSRL